MIVDGSYMAWARPTRRVHLALSVGMTVTGLILTVAGLNSGGGPAQASPTLRRSAESVVSGDTGLPAGAVPPARLVRIMAPAPAPVPAPAPPAAAAAAKPSGKAHPTAGTHGRRGTPESVPASPVPRPSSIPTASRASLTPPSAPVPASPRIPAGTPRPSTGPRPTPSPQR